MEEKTVHVQKRTKTNADKTDAVNLDHLVFFTIILPPLKC